MLVEPLQTRPERVAIVAMGSSFASFVEEQVRRSNTPHKEANDWDEVWTVNRGLKAFRHDKLFVMDDLRWLDERDPKYARWLREHDKPIITSTAYPEWEMAVEYPLKQVLEIMQDEIFAANTVSYMVAYALSIGVKHVGMYGCDFWYPHSNKIEEGSQAVAYCLGMGRYFGMSHSIPTTSTLLYAHKAQEGPHGVRRPFYGYHRKKEDDGKEDGSNGG